MYVRNGKKVNFFLQWLEKLGMKNLAFGLSVFFLIWSCTIGFNTEKYINIFDLINKKIHVFFFYKIKDIICNNISQNISVKK